MAMPELIKLLKTTRLEKKLTQAQVAETIHISPKAYSKIESGANELKHEYIKPICELLDIPYMKALTLEQPIMNQIEPAELARTLVAKAITLNAIKSGFASTHDDRLYLMDIGFDEEQCETIGLSQNELELFKLQASYYGYEIGTPGWWELLTQTLLNGLRNAEHYLFQKYKTQMKTEASQT